MHRRLRARHLAVVLGAAALGLTLTAATVNAAPVPPAPTVAERYGWGDPPPQGSDEFDYTGRLPGGWRTGDPNKAALVVCADTAENGAAVETCSYENDRSEYLPHEVTFHKVKIPLKVYELRTGKRLDPRSVQIGGTSCPRTLYYEYNGGYGLGPGDQFVSASESGVRDAFRPVVER
ncbi:hypothetical protein [Streptomyces sp. NPDC055013]